jgi:hypothetical protein
MFVAVITIIARDGSASFDAASSRRMRNASSWPPAPCRTDRAAALLGKERDLPTVPERLAAPRT